MSASTVKWRNEMHIMLAAFDRQASTSLNNIRIEFKRSGLSFNAEFKQYFLQASYYRIKNTYDEFEIDSMLEDQVFTGSNGSLSTADEPPTMSLFHGGSHDINNTQQEINSPVEIIETSDEEDQVKVESLETASTIQYGNHDIPPEESDDVQIDNDGISLSLSNIEMLDISFGGMNLRQLYSRGMHCQEDVSKSNERNPLKTVAVRAMKVEEMEEDYGISMIDVNTDTSNVRTSTVNRTNVDDCAKYNNMIATPRRASKSYSTPKSFGNKNSLPKPLKMKKLFKCQHCEYFGDNKGNFNRHMRSHTGEKQYRCEVCHKDFIRLRDMKRHKVTHTVEIPFHCRGCFTGFTKEADQKAHEKVCKSRRYECLICKKFVTADKGKFKGHMWKHNGEIP